MLLPIHRKGVCEVVRRALELLVETESRKDIMRYRGSGIWRGDLKAMRRNRV